MKDKMWDFLEKGQNSGGNPEGLESLVDELIHMTTQKTAGQSRSDNKKDLPFATVDLLRWSIVCEATALVLDKSDLKLRSYLKRRTNNDSRN